MAASGSHFTYMLGCVDQDHYDAARACAVPTQEELDYPQYFTSHSDATEIRIRDPYLRKPHQIRNVHEILLLLIQHADAARLPRVVIETCASDEDEYRAKQEATFEQLQQSWGQFGIVIDWSIVDDFHDRSIVTDTGWVIDLGRGLDVYEAYTPLSQFDPRYAIPQLRRTKEITINVSRDTEGHA